jgi:hypothetical protein
MGATRWAGVSAVVGPTRLGIRTDGEDGEEDGLQEAIACSRPLVRQGIALPKHSSNALRLPSLLPTFLHP